MSEQSETGIARDEVPTGQDTIHVGLSSGGEDSAVSAAVANEIVDLDFVAYLSTGTGITENEEYVREYARELGIQPWTLGTHESYEKAVQEHGFPGPSRHGIMYIKLKERQIQKLTKVAGDRELVLWTGVRRSESQRRMGNVESVQEGRRWTWVAPIHDWTKDQCREYLEEHDLPRNPLWDTLGRSGDCFCGCFGSPEEKLDLRAAGCDDHAEWIEELEDRVDIDGKEAMWAWGALSDVEQRAADNSGDSQMTLCSTCGPAYPDGGEL
jgi:3'-phosphoadenosine 5'-phosphosulfate sulfotransferase (PAPS reductase)/FAD synthetase